MPRRKRTLILTQPVKAGLKAIKMRLDARTIITLGSERMIAFWMQRYPNAQVLS